MNRILKNSAVALIVFGAVMLTIPVCNRTPSADNPASKPAAQQAAATIKPPTDSQAVSAAAEKEPIENITDLDHLNSIVENSPGKLLVFDMYADWCRPCRMLAPLYLKLAQTHKDKASFYRVDMTKNQDVAAAFQVNGIPMVVFIKDKEVVQTVTGLSPSENYERVLTRCGASVSVAECKAQLADGL